MNSYTLDSIKLIPVVGRKHHRSVFQDIDNMIGHVDRNIIDLTVPLKHLDGLLENVPDVELVLPLEAVDVALAESDEVSLLAVPPQAQQEVFPVLAAARGLEGGDQLLPDRGRHQLGLARGRLVLTRLQAVGESYHLVIVLVPVNKISVHIISSV